MQYGVLQGSILVPLLSNLHKLPPNEVLQEYKMALYHYADNTQTYLARSPNASVLQTCCVYGLTKVKAGFHIMFLS